LGRIELDAGQPNEALKLFQLGTATAPSPLLRAKLEYDGTWALGLLGLATDALAGLRRALESYQAASDERRPWKNFVVVLPHVEGRTHLALGRFDRATVAFASVVDGTKHAVLCSMENFGHLAAAQRRTAIRSEHRPAGNRPGEGSPLGVGAGQPRAAAGGRGGPARLGMP
jgi:hypothetical protein